MSTNNAKLPNLEPLIQAGIDPKTGLPAKVVDTCDCMIKANIKKLIRIVDEQDAINRYTWYNLPSGLDGQLLERILYYKGQGIFFYLKSAKKFFFLPFALSGTIDVYGRFMKVRPLPFNGTSEADKKDNKEKIPNDWISAYDFTPLYEVIELEKLTLKDIEDSCVILKDYSEQISQTNIPRQTLQDPLLEVMSECIPYMRTALINSTGIKGMRVNDEDQYSSVEAASKATTRAALNGRKYVPIIGQIDFQDLDDGSTAKSEEFLLAMQALDNFRLGMYGIENGGLFQKKAHVLGAEQDMNSRNAGRVYQDGLTRRQRFCDIVNSVWDLGIYVEASETVTEFDRNFDGEILDEQDQSGMMPGTQPEEVVEDDTM